MNALMFYTNAHHSGIDKSINSAHPTSYYSQSLPRFRVPLSHPHPREREREKERERERERERKRERESSVDSPFLHLRLLSGR
jgi:hypothetical protein